MKDSRLFGILLQLLEKKKVTATELSQYFEISVRTIYRDIDALCQLGIPIYTTTGRFGGIHLVEDFIIDRSLLTSSEQESILFALQTFKATRHLETTDLLTKLGVLFQKDSSQWIDVDFARWGTTEEKESQKFLLLKEAILSTTLLNISYVSAKGTISSRTIEPLQLKFKDSAWYLFANCRLRKDYRLFRLSRIIHAEKLQIQFDALFPNQLDVEKDSNGTLIPLKMLVEPAALPHIYDIFDLSAIEWQSNDTIAISAMLPENDWLYTMLFSLGAYLQHLEPETIRQQLIYRYQNALKKLKENDQ